MGRANRMNGYVGEFKSSFLSCEKDMEAIVKKLFVDSRPHSDMLKRLLLINTPDCLYDMTNQAYIDKIRDTSVKEMRDKGYILLEPKIKQKENTRHVHRKWLYRNCNSQKLRKCKYSNVRYK